MNRTPLALLLCLTLALVACGAKVAREEAFAPPAAVGTVNQGLTEGMQSFQLKGTQTFQNDAKIPAAQPMARLIIKNASLSLQVENVRTAEVNIRNLVNQMGGYIVQSSNNGSDEATATTMISFRVPADKFDVVLEELQKLAKKVYSRNVSGEDVTEEFVDLEAQLKNLEATRSRLQTLLDKTDKVSDALEVSKALTDIQGQIEQKLGRKKFLEQSAALSKIDVNLSPVPITPVIPPNSWQPVQIARGALRDLLGFGQGLVNLLILLIVWIPVWLPLGFLIRWGWPKVWPRLKGQGKIRSS